MKVVLTQDVKGTGKKGDTVDVSDGHARNFLLPRHMAIEATKENINAAITKARAEAHKQAERAKDAQELAQSMDGAKITIPVRVGEGGKLFGSVTNKEIASRLNDQFNIKLDKKRVVLKDAIKSIGTYEAELKLHANVSSKVTVEVIPE